MFFGKFRNRYSFNFLATFGLISLLLFCFYVCPELYTTYVVGNAEHAFGVGVAFLCLLGINLLFYVITFFVYIFEIVSNRRITCEKFLNNKYTKIFQNLGMFFVFLPIITAILLLVFYYCI